MRRLTAVWIGVLGGLVCTAAAAQSSVGVGIVVGDPTGLSVKFRLSRVNALDTALAWSLSDDNDLHVRADYIWHKYDVISVKKGRLPLFFGVGGRIEFREVSDDRVGIRFPVGLDYYFSGAPFDVFVELAPVLDVAPDTDFDIEGAIGGRFWL
ncbi:MAG: hypothetical protein ACRDGR_06950 [bacterium]